MRGRRIGHHRDAGVERMHLILGVAEAFVLAAVLTTLQSVAHILF
jgi:hypothetical protein